MKTSCTRHSTPTSQLLKRSLLAITATLALAALNAVAQVTPLSVGSSGVGPIAFDTVPTPAQGWASISIAGGAGDITTTAAMDTAASTNAASNIATQIPTDTGPAAFGTGNPMRWNQTGKFIESRPTGVSYDVLLLGLRNDSGGDKSTVIINYDFGSQFPPTGYETEDDSGRLAGFRVYYSLTGAPQTWTHIPEFDGDTNKVGPVAATISLASPWEAGANLYLIWTDDNAVNGTAGTSGLIEGPWTIDNVKITFQVDPVVITTQPHSVTVEQCRGTNLTVVASGTSPQYQWFKGANAVSGATSATLNIPNAQSSAAGDYFVRVYNSVSSVFSTHATVTVNPDKTDPTVVSSLAKVDGTNIVVTFSEPIQPGSYDTFGFTLVPAAGGNTMSPSAATLATDGKTLTLSFDEARTPNVNYQFYVDPNIKDACAQNPLDGQIGDYGIIAPLKYEIYFLSFENTPWQYNDNGQDLGNTWRLDPGYDDTTDPNTGWQTGTSVFDGKKPQPPGRTTLPGTGFSVMTQLPLTNSTFVDSNIPCYYFRGHFTLPVPPSEVSSLTLRTLVDDFDAAWMNENPTPIRVNPGNPLTDLDAYTYSGGTAVTDAGILGPFSLDPSILRSGGNVVCVKLFQQAGGSSDITFAYELVGVINSFPAAGPSLSISQSGGTVTITWTDASATLYQADSVDATGAAWTAVSGASGGSYSFSAGSTAGAKFFTLRQ